MKLGMFTMPSHPPERSLKDGHDWDLQTIVWADELGFGEFWIGEHHAMVWEPHPAPDLLVVEGLRQTKDIRIGTGGFCLPYHHPAELANRVAMLDHISGGRFNFGFAASGSPTDWEMFGVDGMGGENREMTRESIEIIMNLWTQEPGWSYEGKYWKAAVPNEIPPLLKRHILPLQQPHPPIGVAGLSSPSPTLELAGEKGWIPMSLNLNPGYCKSHWDSYEVGAHRAGRQGVSRSEWRMVREVFVADTDEEAWEHSVNGAMGRMQREYFLPLLGSFGFLPYYKADQDHPDEAVTVEYCAEHNWLIGSPQTVAEKLEKVYADVGGFGHILMLGIDYVEDEPAWKRSMELMANEVMPRVAHLTGD